MYLTECLIENVGPIEELNLTFSIPEKPIIIVGENGTGKSIFLSLIADALTEFAKQAYTDIVPNQLITSPYFKVVSSNNQKVGSSYGLAILGFEHNNSKYSYVEKTGVLDFNNCSAKIITRFPDVTEWPLNDNIKKVSTDINAFSEIFRICSICYFPPSRNELPHWLNKDSIYEDDTFKITRNISKLLNKPIYIERSLSNNKSWLLDVFLDSLIDIEADKDRLVALGDINRTLSLKQGRKNVELLLRQIFQDPYIELAINFRNYSNSRLCIKKHGRVFLPSLDNLSTGQSILFNMFSTIIRYADKANINNSINLDQIQGIVIIDEIDAHLHSELQYNVLAKLIKMFPKVQFIISTHSPLFLLGMDKEYGSDGYDIIEMPSGKRISSERFTEFQRCFEYYKQTKTFEDTITKKISENLKPLILVEGETDPIYIKTAIELLGYDHLLEKVDIDWVGTKINNRNNINSGSSGLDNTKNVIIANPNLLKQKLLLLYDCDTNKPNEDIGMLSIRCCPKNELNKKVRVGIENLFPEDLFESRFYSTKEDIGAYGEIKIISEFNKMEFCKFICRERRNPNDFKSFDRIISIIEKFISR